MRSRLGSGHALGLDDVSVKCDWETGLTASGSVLVPGPKGLTGPQAGSRPYFYSSFFFKKICFFIRSFFQSHGEGERPRTEARSQELLPGHPHDLQEPKYLGSLLLFPGMLAWCWIRSGAIRTRASFTCYATTLSLLFCVLCQEGSLLHIRFVMGNTLASLLPRFFW